MKSNFNSVFKKFSHKIHQFGKIRKYLNTETRVLVYKQTVLPLSEYVSFIMCLNNKHDIDKLQVLQNRALRMCFNIQNPRDISIQRLHEMAKVDMLYNRRMLQLLSIVYDLRSKSLYQHHHARNVRSADKYTFEIKRANIEL